MTKGWVKLKKFTVWWPEERRFQPLNSLPSSKSFQNSEIHTKGEISLQQLDEKLAKYAVLLVDTGLNVQKGGRVFIRYSVDAMTLIRLATSKASQHGAQ